MPKNQGLIKRYKDILHIFSPQHHFTKPNRKNKALINHISCIFSINPFPADVPILYPLKTLENQRFSGVFRVYKMGTLAGNGLIAPYESVNLMEINLNKWSFFPQLSNTRFKSSYCYSEHNICLQKYLQGSPWKHHCVKSIQIQSFFWSEAATGGVL